MRRQILVSALIVVLVPAFATARSYIRVRPGPGYPIQNAIDIAGPDDVIIVDKGVYRVPYANGFDFGTKKNLILKSHINETANELSEAEWDTVAETIIDCQGSKWGKTRAFKFATGNDSKIYGFTITNGFMFGARGYDGQAYTPFTYCDHDHIVPDDGNSPPRACNGQTKEGYGYGGAILCQNSSPTIKFCVIKNCTVAGGIGGDGRNGINLVDEDSEWCYYTDPNADPECVQDGQFGGHGGDGCGSGYGAAIACLGNSKPTIEGCIFKDNVAVGGIGGDGGNGGDAAGSEETTWLGLESGGGRGGKGVGHGVGGAIYCDPNTNNIPTIERCQFINNTAKQGLGGEPGERGRGDTMTSPLEGQDPLDLRKLLGLSWDRYYICHDTRHLYIPWVYPPPPIAGGAAFFDHNSTATFIDCNLVGNQAVEEVPYCVDTDIIYDIDYKYGGALYCNGVNDVILKSCRFIDNKAGAVYIEPEYIDPDPNFAPFYTNTVQITADPTDPNKGLFSGNTEAWHGGAIHVDSGTTHGVTNEVKIAGYNFDNNWAYSSGGAVFCLSDANLEQCSFTSNQADYQNYGIGYGGAYAQWGDKLAIRDCVFAGNKATYGGALYTYYCEIEEIAHSYFTGNTADSGGAISLEFSEVADINSCKIQNNRATYASGYGGGIDCINSDLAIVRNCEISGNIAEGADSHGGGLSLDGGPANHTLTNCLLKDNAANTGGAVSFTYCGTDPNYVTEVANCTFSGNSAAAEGGGIYVDYKSEVEIIDSIFSNCTSGAIFEDDWGGEAKPDHVLFYANPPYDFYDYIAGEFDFNSVPDANNNFNGDPCFVDPFSADANLVNDFRLKQIGAPLGWTQDSLAVDAGSQSASAVFGPEFTTRTDNGQDSGMVDLGYHYHRSAGAYVPKYGLTILVSGSGTVEKDPNQDKYLMGTAVNLTATPALGWTLESWHGTDDDTQQYLTNTATMYYSRTVLVKFREVKTISVGIDPNYPTIQSGIYAAENGDIVEVSLGTWKEQGIIIDKPITVRAADPYHPEDTVIDSGDHGGYWGDDKAGAVFFDDNAGPGTVFEGFTVTGDPNWWWRGDDGEPSNDDGENGQDGGCTNGLGIYISTYASPVIRNCIIRHHRIEGGDGTDGVQASNTSHAGRGGWGGWARGAGVYCAAYSTPTFINCHIMENHARGGIGGLGGDWSPTGGRANYGGNWSADPTADRPNFDIDFGSWPYGKDETQPLWQVWQRHPETPWCDDFGNCTRRDYIGDYRWYTGYGGGVFCNVGSDVKFINCKIIGNRTSGGNSGEGGYFESGSYDRKPPKFSYQLPSYGGGVYCAADTKVTFTDCIIANNIAQEPNEYYHLDADLGHGGGVCAEDSASVTFENCLISGNKASDGGGLLLDHATPTIIDCVIRNNTAYEGGGITAIGGPVDIVGSTIAFNTAGGMVTDPNKDESPDNYDPNNDYYLPGNGGGIYCDSTDVFIIDSNISNNEAGGAGGGAFVQGETSPTVFNCLFKDNIADMGGGGIAVHLYSVTTLKNCTLADNSAYGSHFADHFGGGLYCFDNATALVTNCILWDNAAEFGSQIAIDQGPSTVDVNYSNVHGGAGSVFVGSGCTLIWPYDPNNPDDSPNLRGTAADNPDFVYGNLDRGEAGHSFLNTGSPCVNRGSDKAKKLDMYRHTTRTDGQIDGYDYNGPDAIVDLGYHYILRTNLTGDFNFDGVVDGDDCERLTDPNVYWLKGGCKFPDFCYGMDLNKDGQVNFLDYARFALNYKKTEKTPPQPNPMTWEKPPASPSEGSSSITMTATEATDNSTETLYYQFKRICPSTNEFDWDTKRTFTETGVVGTVYGYQVRACDTTDPNARATEDPNHVTGWSFPAYARCGDVPPDREPPTPNPPQWEEEPHGIDIQSIAMTAAPVIDDSTPVEYRFQFVQYYPDPVIKGDSDWQTSRDWTYFSLGLDADSCYCCFRFMSRDAEGNESKWSENIVACTLASGEPNEVDETPPVTNSEAADPYQAQWEVRPNVTPGGNHTMMAREATDDTGPVWYYFKCIQGNGLDSGWQQERIYTYYWTSNCYYSVITRDSAGPPNAGHWSIGVYTGQFPDVDPPDDPPPP